MQSLFNKVAGLHACNFIKKKLQHRCFPVTVCSCHVTYAFQSESTLYSCLNVKELLVRSRREIWSLSDCNWTRSQNHLVRNRTLSHGWVFVMVEFVYELSGSGFESSCSHFSCDICEIFKKTCFHRIPPTAASDFIPFWGITNFRN